MTSDTEARDCLSRTELADRFQRIHALNKTIMTYGNDTWKTRTRSMGPAYVGGLVHISPDERLTDMVSLDGVPAHHKIVINRAKAERETHFAAIKAAVESLPGIYSAATRLTWRLRVRPSGNSAFDIEIDGMPVHPRPVTATYFSRRFAKLVSDLRLCPDTGPVRHWIIRNRALTAASARQALWKYLCLEHPPHAAELRTARSASADTTYSPAMTDLLDRMSVYEIRNSRTLADAIANDGDAPRRSNIPQS